jgi:hypothetical protein
LRGKKLAKSLLFRRKFTIYGTVEKATLAKRHLVARNEMLPRAFSAPDFKYENRIDQSGTVLELNGS